jgi:hypothetical protein
MRLCVSEWMKFIATHKGTLGYDYRFGDRRRPRLTTEDIQKQVASLLSCDNDEWQRVEDDENSDESANDGEVGDQTHAWPL